MKGARLYAAIMTPLALFLGIAMAVFGWNESWSQNHNSPFDPFLYATLFCIAITFVTGSYEHPKKFRVVTKIKKWEIRLEHLLRLTAMLFGGVIVFGVNSPVKAVETLHLVFTGLAIASGYIMIMTYSESKRGQRWSLIGLILGTGGFLLGYLGKFYSVAFAEVIATIPFVVWIFNTWVLKKDR